MIPEWTFQKEEKTGKADLPEEDDRGEKKRGGTKEKRETKK